jgi:hypothetical protein
VSPYVYAELTKSPNPLISYNSVAESHQQTITYHRCTVRRLRPPQDPSGPTKEASTPARQRAPANPDKTDEPNDNANVGEERVVYVGWGVQVPQKHIAPSSMWDGLDDWDNVRCGL